MDKIIFFDVETTSQWAPYADLKMIGYQVGMYGNPTILDPDDKAGVKEFKERLASPDWTKVHFNGINYDEIVLRLHGFPVCPVNRHDVYLMAKTVAPASASYGLKFLNWYYYGDPHEPERRLHAWCQHHRTPMWEAPYELLSAYCCHDVRQTVRLYNLYWSMVQTPRHWRAYSELELGMGPVLHEIMLEGGECLNLEVIRREKKRLQTQVRGLNVAAYRLTQGAVKNLSSGRQVSRYLSEVEDFELAMSDKGNLILRKDDLLTMLDLNDPQNDQSKLARLTYECRDAIKQSGYLNSYRRALLYECRTLNGRRVYRKQGYGIIPKSYSLSGARTRRILSSSRFGINFQNQNHSSKSVQLVPAGWLGIWLDSTQIENVVHMWASNDLTRVKSYSKDPDWSEYVWLCNQILGGRRTREQLEEIKSDANPAWSVYKQFKTCKLALNFGMGISKFAKTNRIEYGEAKEIFTAIHKACPAIKGLQRKIAQELATKGYIQDPFGHIYTGDPEQAYKVVAYYIQGCGTGSVPKAMARAVWETLQALNPAGEAKRALMTTLTHDEIGFRIWLGVPDRQILDILWKCLECMEGRFSPFFGGIPLRAKLSVSITNAAEARVVNHYHMTREDWESRIMEDYIKPGRELL
jgi:hypothetical protein